MKFYADHPHSKLMKYEIHFYGNTEINWTLPKQSNTLHFKPHRHPSEAKLDLESLEERQKICRLNLLIKIRSNN